MKNVDGNFGKPPLRSSMVLLNGPIRYASIRLFHANTPINSVNGSIISLISSENSYFSNNSTLFLDGQIDDQLENNSEETSSIARFKMELVQEDAWKSISNHNLIELRIRIVDEHSDPDWFLQLLHSKIIVDEEFLSKCVNEKQSFMKQHAEFIFFTHFDYVMEILPI